MTFPIEEGLLSLYEPGYIHNLILIIHFFVSPFYLSPLELRQFIVNKMMLI